MLTYPIEDEELPLSALSRRRERLLLILAGVFLTLAQSSTLLTRGYSAIEFWRLIVWGVCAVVGHRVLNTHLPRRDALIFPTVMLLTGWGLVSIDRLSPYFALRQTVWLMVATATMISVVILPGHLRWLSNYRYLWLIGGLFLLALTIVLGRNPTFDAGPRLWLGISDVYFQPSELLKLLLIVFLASYLADHHALIEVSLIQIGPLRLPSPRFLGPLLLLWSLSIIILIWQRDLGTATLFFIVFVIMLYLASGQLVYVIGGTALLIVAGIVAYGAFFVVRQRVAVWINPWPLANAEGFQIVQSLMAFSSGGIFGQGVAQGSPTYIPVVHSDFVFAAVGEEWGLFGALVVTALMAMLVLRGLRLSAQVQVRAFRSYLAAGISMAIGVQSLLIMGGTLALIPLTGITLPFLSYGGSSLVITFAMIGLLLVISGER